MAVLHIFLICPLHELRKFFVKHESVGLKIKPETPVVKIGGSYGRHLSVYNKGLCMKETVFIDIAPSSCLDQITYYHERQDMKKHIEADCQLHGLIIRIGGNRLVEDMYQRISAQVQQFRIYSLESKRRFRESLVEHTTVVHCLLTGNVEEADRVNRRHLELARDKINEYLISKRRYSAFFATDLEILLKGLKVDTLYMIGGLTDVCIHYTAVDAHQHDYRIRVVTDAVAGSSEEAHNYALKAIHYLQRDALVTTADIES